MQRWMMATPPSWRTSMPTGSMGERQARRVARLLVEVARPEQNGQWLRWRVPKRVGSMVARQRMQVKPARAPVVS